MSNNTDNNESVATAQQLNELNDIIEEANALDGADLDDNGIDDGDWIEGEETEEPPFDLDDLMAMMGMGAPRVPGFVMALNCLLDTTLDIPSDELEGRDISKLIGRVCG